MIERRYGYWVQLSETTRTLIPNLSDDSDLKKEGGEEEVDVPDKAAEGAVITCNAGPFTSNVPLSNVRDQGAKMD